MICGQSGSFFTKKSSKKRPIEDLLDQLIYGFTESYVFGKIEELFIVQITESLLN